MRRVTQLCTVALFATLFVSVSHGQVYTDRQAFLDATNATTVTQPYPDSSTSVLMFTSGDIRFDAGSGSSLNFGAWTPVLPGNDLALNGAENLDVNYVGAATIYAIGIEFRDAPAGEPSGGDAPSTWTITPRLNQVAVPGATTFTTPDANVNFIGFHSEVPIDELSITENSGANQNEFFGQVFVSEVANPGVASACIGIDCSTIVSQSDRYFRLRANNTRIRFYNTALPPGLGESWVIRANSSANAESSFIRFEVTSLEIDDVRRSFGNSPRYTCNPGETVNTIPEIIPGEFVPFGEPTIIWQTTGQNTYECQTVPATTRRSLMQISPAPGGAALGHQSQVVGNSISLGRADLTRTLKHVAMGLASTDLITLANIDDWAAQPDPHQTQIQQIQAQLNALQDALNLAEQQVAVLESDDDQDGLNKYAEENVHGTNPNVADSDGDGAADGLEVSLGLEPLNPDTDDDGVTDGAEIAQGLDPLDICDGPATLCRSRVLHQILQE